MARATLAVISEEPGVGFNVQPEHEKWKRVRARTQDVAAAMQDVASQVQSVAA